MARSIHTRLVMWKNYLQSSCFSGSRPGVREDNVFITSF